MLILVLLLELALVTYLVRRYVGLTNILNPIVPLYYYHTVFFFWLCYMWNDTITLSSLMRLFI